MKNRLIIIGASGVIGQALYILTKNSGYKLIATYHNKKIQGLVKYDMRASPLRSVVTNLNQHDIVFLLSAYSEPTWISKHQNEAIKVNLIATKKLVDEIFLAEARLIFMSSVEVFDGKYGNYTEKSIPHPLTLYGRLKFEIEKYLDKKKGSASIVRTGWNVCWNPQNRCVIKLTYESLLQPGARMARENIFSIIDVNDTARGLLKLARNPSVRICHMAATPPLIRSELADAIMKISNNKNLRGFTPVSFSEIKYTEPRGQYNQIINSRTISDLSKTFKPAYEIIKQKVSLLDDYYVRRNL